MCGLFEKSPRKSMVNILSKTGSKIQVSSRNLTLRQRQSGRAIGLLDIFPGQHGDAETHDADTGFQEVPMSREPGPQHHGRSNGHLYVEHDFEYDVETIKRFVLLKPLRKR